MRAVAFCGVVCIHTVQDRATMLMAEAGRFAVPLFLPCLDTFYQQIHPNTYLIIFQEFSKE